MALKRFVANNDKGDAMNRWRARLLSASLALLISSNPVFVSAQVQSSLPSSDPGENNPGGPQQLAALPDSASASWEQSNSAPAPSSSPESSPQSSSAQTKSQTPTPQTPTGTAAAPGVTTSGNAASRPAGAAIAPPKQRQVHSLLLKLGLIAGAGVALGTVAALSMASPSRVPGSH
jgi:hypothetical protein